MLIVSCLVNTYNTNGYGLLHHASLYAASPAGITYDRWNPWVGEGWISRDIDECSEASNFLRDVLIIWFFFVLLYSCIRGWERAKLLGSNSSWNDKSWIMLDPCQCQVDSKFKFPSVLVRLVSPLNRMSRFLKFYILNHFPKTSSKIGSNLLRFESSRSQGLTYI